MKRSAIIGFVLSFVLLAGCGRESKTAEAVHAAPVAVQAIDVSEVEWPAGYEAVGTVRARTAATISAKMMGYVREVRVQAGDSVRAGQLLVLLDSRDLEAAYRQAEAGLAEARNAMSEVNNAIAAADANLNLTRKTYNRMKELYDKRSISDQEFDEAASRLRVAQANAQMAVSKRSQLGSRIAQAQQAVAAAGVMRSYAEIHAPFAGMVTAKSVDPGNLAAPGAPLLTIEKTGAYRLETQVEESRLGSIRAGQAVQVSLDAIGHPIAARVAEVIPAVDSSSRSFIVKIDLPALPQLHSGLFGRALFETGTRRVLAVPRAAIVQQGQIQSALVADSGFARNRLLTFGQSRDDQVEVLSGLSAGEKVIVNRPMGLVDGAAVEVRP